VREWVVYLTIFAGFVVSVTFTHSQDRRLEERFSELTQTNGAWSMDREAVSKHIGLEVNKLPSLQESKSNGAN